MQNHRGVCFGWFFLEFFAFALGVNRSADAQVVLAVPEGRKSLELILVDDAGNLPDSNGRGGIGSGSWVDQTIRRLPGM